jgi:TonB-linked SusC/RagA family outer membrane protein
MRKFTFLLVIVLLCGLQAAFAQKTITGTVTSADDGAPLIGVTVIIKGTTIGNTTNLSGEYTIEVPDDTEALLFSYVGMATQEIPIGDRTIINVELSPSAVAMEEVVVTALGITREQKSLGYAVQDVSADEITRTRPNNVISALSGKVSGVQISNSSGNVGGSSLISIRGSRSVKGDNQPIFIVDGVILDNSNFTTTDQARGGGGYDYGNMANDINPDDIATLSVLKGPAASALYGSRAANGVIIIETKKGQSRAKSGKKGIGVSFNTGATFSMVSILPKYQNQYGGGYGWDTLWFNENPEGFPNRSAGLYTDAAKGTYDLMPNYRVDESWGPELNGQMIRPWYSFNKNISEFYGKNVPWVAQEDNIKDYYKTGQTWSNNVALTGGSEDAFFRLSYTNVKEHGVSPNATRTKNTINFNGNTKLSEKLTAFTNINYINTKADNLVGTGYDGRNVVNSFNQWFQRQVDMNKLEDYWLNGDGTQNTWNRTAWDNGFPKYWDNPYWTSNMNYANNNRERVFGNFGATYELNDWLRITGKVNKDFYTDRREERLAVGSNENSYYKEGIYQLSETNAEFLVEFNKYLTEDISLKAIAGGNQMTRKYNRNIGTTSGGLPIPGFYNLANTTDPIIVDDYTRKKKINSLYGAVSLGWKSMVYLDFTARNDWSSTLPIDNNSYFYPSVTGSFVFSELPVFEDLKWMSMGKVRAAWAKVGNDTDPYRLYSVYTPKENFGSNPLYTVPNRLNNAELKPEQTTSWEIGGDFKFFNNRLGIDATYYKSESTDQIIPIPISGSTGYTSTYLNAGQIDNKGIELFLTGTPVKTKAFSWDIYVNWSKNENKVVELADGLDQLQLANAPFSVSVNAFTGQPYGTIMGRDYVYVNGQKFVNSSGMYESSEKVVPLGNVQPDWIGGVGNSLSYKNYSLSFLFDFRKGGDIFSTSYMWGVYSGILEESTDNNIREDGIVLEGLMEDPNTPGTYITNDQNIDANTYGLNHYYVGAMNIFKTDFIKLREVSLTYKFPQKWVSKTPFQNIVFSLYGRNLFVFATDLKHIDPEHVISTNNIQGIEGAQLPSTRSFGFNLSVNL